MIPKPADQIGHRKDRGSPGGRPVNFNADRYCGRNVVERGFNRIKNWRGLATRYDKHVLIYRGGVVLAAILLWLTIQQTRPRCSSWALAARTRLAAFHPRSPWPAASDRARWLAGTTRSAC